MTYKVQIDDTVRDATLDEAAALDAQRAAATAAAAVADDLARARASAVAKLAALGLSDNEINALVG
jgi:alkylhydroperoxidase family enzyme